ncbi:hypothetical protein ACFXKJ_04935 [Kitasatospora indigofera]
MRSAAPAPAVVLAPATSRPGSVAPNGLNGLNGPTGVTGVTG